MKNDVSRMEYHMKELKKVCRVCGKRLHKAKGRERSYVVADHSQKLAEVFSLDVSNDCQDTHPPSFCNCCRIYMHSWYKRGESVGSVGRVFAWTKQNILNPRAL